jgi:phage baseplate assembly protein W
MIMAIQRLYEKLVVKGRTPKGIPPLPRTYRGFSSISDETESFSLYDLALIKQDIINHFHVRQGERLMNPEFGTIIWDVIFEPLTEDLQELIAQNVADIINYEPRVVANNIIVTAYESGIQIECDLTYLPYDVSESLRFRFDQDNGLIG